MSVGKFLTGTIIVTPAVGVVGYVTYDQLYNSTTVAELKPTRDPSGWIDIELNRQREAEAGIHEDAIDVTYSSHSR